MNVILLEDVPDVGKKYQEAEVADGYGTNYLIPNGLAQVATDETRARFQKKQAEAAATRKKERESLAAKLETITDEAVTITVARSGDQGQLFAGVYPKDIAQAINEQFDIDISAADIERDQPISKVGAETVLVTILDTEAELNVIVSAEETGVSDPDEDKPEEETDDNEASSEESDDDGEDVDRG
jgi:large subunit ribosomal protein L9